MPPRIRPGNEELGEAIRARRSDLALSIQDASARAGVGAKTWARYEAGQGIREDKVRGVCRALGWSKLPDAPFNKAEDEGAVSWMTSVGEGHAAWSRALEERFGRACAITFAVGSDVLGDQIRDDLSELSSRPRGTHIGELPTSWLDGSLPKQFVPRYDYDLIYSLAAAVEDLRLRFVTGTLIAHTVLEEIAAYLIFSQAEEFADANPAAYKDEEDDWRDWTGDILGDLDVEWYLFSGHHVITPNITYHFDHWAEYQFWTDDPSTPAERAAAQLGTLHMSTRPVGEDKDEPESGA